MQMYFVFPNSFIRMISKNVELEHQSYVASEKGDFIDFFEIMSNT